MTYSFIYIFRFIPSNTAANAIHDAIEAHYEQPWTVWRGIPLEVRDKMFSEFKVIF